MEFIFLEYDQRQLLQCSAVSFISKLADCAVAAAVGMLYIRTCSGFENL
jgi:hypothetical protein